MTVAVVFHPRLQHSHQLAWGLAEKHLLLKFFSGVPVLGLDEHPPLWLPERFRTRLRQTGIPSANKSHPVIFYFLQQIVGRRFGALSRLDNLHRVFHLFDNWSALQVEKLRPRVVIAYENSAYQTFLAAKKIGATCILDLPSIERRAAENLLDPPFTRYTETIDRRKDAEVELADIVLTCSKFAAATYAEAGVTVSKIKCLYLGAEHSNLPRLDEDAPVRLKFIFAGTLSSRKSADILFDVFERIAREDRPISLEIAGGIAEPAWHEKLRSTPNVRYVGNLSQSELFAHMRRADCLLLPSRFDSFGMVVLESLACGTPAIVSSYTGAKEIFNAFPDAGWIIEPSVDSLYQCILERWEQRDSLPAARIAASHAAAAFSWAKYRENVSEIVASSF